MGMIWFELQYTLIYSGGCPPFQVRGFVTQSFIHLLSQLHLAPRPDVKFHSVTHSFPHASIHFPT